MALTDIRCGQCGRKLARASNYCIIEIKCPRCGRIQRATSPMHNDNGVTRGKPDNSVDGRQAPPG